MYKKINELLFEFQELLYKMPTHCRIHLLNYAIHNTELVLQTRNRNNDCYQCLDNCLDCKILKTTKK